MNNESGDLNCAIISYLLISNINLIVCLILPSNLLLNLAALALVSYTCDNTCPNKLLVLYNVLYIDGNNELWGP